MALSGCAGRRKPRQLSGVKRTSKFKSVTSAFDPKRTFGALFDHLIGGEQTLRQQNA